MALAHCRSDLVEWDNVVKARHALVRSDQAAEQAIVAMLADDNLGEKLVNIGLPLAQSSLEAFAAIEVTTISI